MKILFPCLKASRLFQLTFVIPPLCFEASTIGLGDFFLGVNTGAAPTPRDAYGWVRLRNSGGVISMVDNAVSYGGGGIIVGTLEEIPEPSIAQFALASLCLWLMRRARR